MAVVVLDRDHVLRCDETATVTEEIEWSALDATLFVNIADRNHLRIRGSGLLSDDGSPTMQIEISFEGTKPHMKLTGRCFPTEFAALNLILDVSGLGFTRDLTILDLEGVSTSNAGAAHEGGIKWSGLQIRMNGGQFKARMSNERVEVLKADRCEIQSDVGQRVRLHQLSECVLDGVHVEIARGSTAQAIEGSIHLSDCHGFLSAVARDRGKKPRYLEVLSIDDGASLSDAQIQGICLPSGNSLIPLLQRAEESSRFNPASENFRVVVRSVRHDQQGFVADLLFDVLRAKAQDPIATDKAAIEVLDARRRSESGLRRLILEAYRATGYARSVSRPIVVWSLIALTIVAWRFCLAMRTPKGYLPHHLGWGVIPLGFGVGLHALLILFSLGQDVQGDLMIGIGVFLLVRALELGCAVALIAALRGLLRTRFDLSD
jgi:hypothetical protein